MSTSCFNWNLLYVLRFFSIRTEFNEDLSAFRAITAEICLKWKNYFVVDSVVYVLYWVDKIVLFA